VGGLDVVGDSKDFVKFLAVVVLPGVVGVVVAVGQVAGRGWRCHGRLGSGLGLGLRSRGCGGLGRGGGCHCGSGRLRLRGNGDGLRQDVDLRGVGLDAVDNHLGHVAALLADEIEQALELGDVGEQRVKLLFHNDYCL